MITYSKIGKKGNLGNQLFQIASTIGLAKKNNQEFGFLPWKYQHYFKNQLPSLNNALSDFSFFEEPNYHYQNLIFENKNYDLEGWLQTEKYFDRILTKHYFQFADKIIKDINDKYINAFSKKTILLSIRRGDFVNHPDYFQVTIDYYLKALIDYFPDWQTRNMIILSDDINYCKFHFSFLKNVFFGDDLNAIEQLCLGSLCDDFIIGNSTFSWWTAWLGEKTSSKVVRPFSNFDGLKSKELDDKDYFPERWIKYNHRDKKIKLDDIVFCINSSKNANLLKQYILNFFDLKVEVNSNSSKGYNKVYVFNKDYFLPPILIYYTYLKINGLKKGLVINNVTKIFKVSKKLNFATFLFRNDFGIFSKIFSFSKCRSKKLHKDIYLKDNTDYEKKSGCEFASHDLVINCNAGQFCEIGGYAYSFGCFINEHEIKIKQKLIKMLSIK